MIKVILEEDNIMVSDFVNNDEFNLLKRIGITDNDRLTSAKKKISRYLCNKHHEGSLCFIDEKVLTNQDKELLEIRNKITEKETYITY